MLSDLSRHVVIFNYSVAYLVIFAVTGFLIALGTLVGVGCDLNETICDDPTTASMSEIVDQPSLYPWFAVFCTLFVVLLLIVFCHYTNPVRVRLGQRRSDYHFSMAVFFLQFVGSVLFLVVVLLPITLHPDSHVMVVQIAFAFILSVHFCTFLRIVFCEYGEWKSVIVAMQLLHFGAMIALGVLYIQNDNGFLEIAFILTVIAFYYYLAYEYWSVNVTCVANDVSDDSNERDFDTREEHRHSGKPLLGHVKRRLHYPRN